MALKLSAPKKNGQDLSPEQIELARPKPFPIKVEFDGIEWEIWVDFRRVSPAIANEYIVAYSRGLLAGKANEGMKDEILALAHTLKQAGQISGAVESPKAARNRKNAKVEPAEPVLTMEDVERVAEITRKIKEKSSEYTLANIVATGEINNELYETECAVVAAAVIRLDENGEVANVGRPALNYPDFDPTFENLLATGQIGPAIVRAVMAEFHPTSAVSRPATPATETANSTS